MLRLARTEKRFEKNIFSQLPKRQAQILDNAESSHRRCRKEFLISENIQIIEEILLYNLINTF